MALSVAVLRVRDFRLMLCARMFAMMALQAQAVIVGWQVYSITKDPLMLGLAGLTEAVPAILCALVAGHIVDNSKPYRVYLACMAALSLNTLMLFLIAGDVIHAPGGNLLPWIFGGIFISGLARGFIMPASFTLLSQIVSRTQIPAASAWLSSGFQLGAISGPAIAGIIYGGFGARMAWTIPTSLMIIAFLLICGFSHHPRHYRNLQPRERAVASITAGWKFILSHPVLLSVMALDMFAVLLGGVVAILPAVADQLLQVGPEQLGAMRAAPAIGAIGTALVMALHPAKQVRVTTLLIVVTGFGFCMIGFGLSTSFYLSLGLLALSGAFDSVSMVMRGTLMQLLTPENMKGRVSSVNAMFIISSNELGAFRAGVTARFLGLVPSIVIGGIATLGVVAVSAAASKKFRRTVVDAEQS